MPWRSLEAPIFPWVKTLDRIMTFENPPRTTGPTLMLASDYAGTSGKSRYSVCSVVCADVQRSARWEMARRQVRRGYMADGRRMSYKALSDRQRAQALDAFLAAANEIQGVCLVVAVSRKIRHLCLCQSAAHYQRLRTESGLRARWKDEELEEVLRVTQLIACLVGGMSRPRQNIYWISDQDSMFANTKRHRDVIRLLSSFSGHYVKHPLGQLGVGTTAIDEGDRLEEDLAAIADLTAGAVAEATNKLSEACGGTIPSQLAVDYPPGIIPKAERIANWLWSPVGTLRRVVMLFERHSDGAMSVARYNLIDRLSRDHLVMRGR